MLNRTEIGTLLLRIMLGLVFLASGVTKFQGGIGNTVGWFDSIGIPGFLAYIVATIELVGGITIILGLGTRIVSLLFGIIMIGAIFTVKIARWIPKWLCFRSSPTSYGDLHVLEW